MNFPTIPDPFEPILISEHGPDGTSSASSGLAERGTANHPKRWEVHTYTAMPSRRFVDFSDALGYAKSASELDQRSISRAAIPSSTIWEITPMHDEPVVTPYTHVGDRPVAYIFAGIAYLKEGFEP